MVPVLVTSASHPPGVKLPREVVPLATVDTSVNETPGPTL